MITVVELRKKATQLKIKGRSKLRTKSLLLKAIEEAEEGKKVTAKIVLYSRKLKMRSTSASRRCRKRKSRSTSASRRSRKLKMRSTSASRRGTKLKMSSSRIGRKQKHMIKNISRKRKTDIPPICKPLSLKISSKHNPCIYQNIINSYVEGDKKIIKKLNVEYRNNRLACIRFGKNNSMYGNFSYFIKCLQKLLGNAWASRILNKKDNVNIYGKIQRLGVPGRQGTVILLTCGRGRYAVKVTRKGTSCGDGVTGNMGFFKQARMQEIASKHGITCPVLAVYCGHEKLESFMVMLPMKNRLVDIYKKGDTLSEKHQKQLWNIYLKLDKDIGILHNDNNCLNIMTDYKDNLKIIDFDRSKIIETNHIKKFGAYPNLKFIYFISCFRRYGIKPGKLLLEKYCKLFNDGIVPNDGKFPLTPKKWNGLIATKL